MKVLIVARQKGKGFAPFVTEQVTALEQNGVECQFFPMHGKGIVGYLRELPSFKKAIKSFKPDIIHAHYGLCGLFANLQRRIPVVTTYHGSDINNTGTQRLSKLAIRLSAFNIFVSQKTLDIARPKKRFALLPCGINLEDFPPISKKEAREKLGLKADGKYVLFAGGFDDPAKNASLAQEAVAQINSVELLELKGYSRPQVAILMQATDTLLLTSHAEGSPQVIKEALACGSPIVSVDVGDVKERTAGISGCWISQNSSAEELAKLLKAAFQFSGRTKGREAIVSTGLTNTTVADKLISIYESLK